MPPLLSEASSFSDDEDVCKSRSSHCETLHETVDDSLLTQVAKELQWMKANNDEGHYGLHRFPPACCRMVKSLHGNNSCMDCGSRSADWASTSYGVLLCLQCSGRHRSLGVKISKVRSLTLDHWSHEQILSMLEGGNQQLFHFFDRHRLTKTPITSNAIAEPTVDQLRYRTKAAKFYREHLNLHVKRVTEIRGLYKGREVSRKTCNKHTESPPLGARYV